VSAFFITATGTDIGKTFVTAGLVRRLRSVAQDVNAIKPVMTGYDPHKAQESDAGVLLGALGQSQARADVEAISPWRYSAPLSPDMAAAGEGKRLDVEALINHTKAQIAKVGGTLLIEGVGGVMVPLDDNRTVLDWISALNIPVLLIAGSYLGAISHTLTSLDVLRRSGIAIAAAIINESVGSTVPLENTSSTVRRFSRGITVLPLPRLQHQEPDHPTFAAIAAQLGLPD
jgi:dethiobiotin synthetase